MLHPAYLGIIRRWAELTSRKEGRSQARVSHRNHAPNICSTLLYSAYGVWRQPHSCRVQKKKLLETSTNSQGRSMCYIRDLMQGQAHNSRHMQFVVTKITLRSRRGKVDPLSRELLEGFSKLFGIREWRYVYTSRDRLISDGTNMLAEARCWSMSDDWGCYIIGSSLGGFTTTWCWLRL